MKICRNVMLRMKVYWRAFQAPVCSVCLDFTQLRLHTESSLDTYNGLLGSALDKSIIMKVHYTETST